MKLVGNWKREELNGTEKMLWFYPAKGILPVGTRLLWGDWSEEKGCFDIAMVAMDETAKVELGFVRIPESDFQVNLDGSPLGS